MELEDVKVGPYTVSIIRDDQYIGNCLRHGQEWDGWMRRDLPHIVRSDQDILDIGGNIGWNALMFSEYAKVYTFEPLFHEVLSKNVEQNRTLNPIVVCPYGLSNTTGRVRFALPDRDGSVCNYGGSRVSPENGTIQADLKRLDDVYSGTPCLLKIDVEGHELEVLRGAENTIRRHRPNLYVEIFDFEDGPVRPFLEHLGYRKVIPRPEHNYLFVNWS